MKANLKIRRRKIRNGYALTLAIVHNFRHPASGVATNRTLAYLGSIRETDIPRKAAEFYARLETELDRLKGQIYDNCADEIRRKCQTVLPKPPVTTASPIKDIRAILAERGYTV